MQFYVILCIYNFIVYMRENERENEREYEREYERKNV